MAKKPRIPALWCPVLCEIDEYIRRYDIRGERLKDAASDVIDSWLTRKEVAPMFRRRLLALVPLNPHDCDPREDQTLCGTSWTVDMTPRLMCALWPDRIAA